MPDSDDRASSAPRRREPDSRRGGELLIGRLKEHGPANYQFREKDDPSYYLKLLTTHGERIIWGKDLKRAVTDGETRPKVGDLIGARRIAREAVTVTSRQRDAEGRIIAQEERHAHRTQWVVEKVTFFAERARMARRLRDEQADVRDSIRAHPDLKSTFLSVRAAEEFAAKSIPNPEDRGRFLDLVRGAMAESIRKGEPLPSTSIRNRSPELAGPLRPVAPKREDPTR
jgi:hypothetical protein